MAGINQQNTLHANRIRIVVDGVVLAEGTSVSAQESGGTQPIRTINSEYAREHVHNAYDVSGTIAALYWRSQNLAKFNVGTTELVQLPEFEIRAFDETGSKLLFVMRRCTLASRSLSISANQPVQRNVQVMAVSVDDGNGRALLTGGANIPGIGSAFGTLPL